jgi:hypothetical protein
MRVELGDERIYQHLHLLETERKHVWPEPLESHSTQLQMSRATLGYFIQLGVLG